MNQSPITTPEDRVALAIRGLYADFGHSGYRPEPSDVVHVACDTLDVSLPQDEADNLADLVHDLHRASVSDAQLASLLASHLERRRA